MLGWLFSWVGGWRKGGGVQGEGEGEGEGEDGGVLEVGPLAPRLNAVSGENGRIPCLLLTGRELAATLRPRLRVLIGLPLWLAPRSCFLGPRVVPAHRGRMEAS